jgi:hypothetical protein
MLGGLTDKLPRVGLEPSVTLARIMVFETDTRRLYLASVSTHAAGVNGSAGGCCQEK